MVANRDTKFGDYCREANRLKIPQVNVLDKQEVIDYFTGKLAESQKIDTDIRPKTYVRKADVRMGKGPIVAKKRDAKAQEKEESKFEVCDHLHYNEKKIHSRSTVI